MYWNSFICLYPPLNSELNEWGCFVSLIYRLDIAWYIIETMTIYWILLLKYIVKLKFQEIQNTWLNVYICHSWADHERKLRRYPGKWLCQEQQDILKAPF